MNNSGNNNNSDDLELSLHVPPLPNGLIQINPGVIKLNPADRKYKLGYDMKSLRVQLESLQQEMVDFSKSSHILYDQNRLLWEYLLTLLSVCRSNAVNAKTYIKNLNDKLYIINKEKNSLIGKLENVKNSREMLRQMNEELSQVQGKNKQVLLLKEEAERQLNISKKENQLLEESLNDKLIELQSQHNYIDQQKLIEKEAVLDERADEFYYTNQKILRSAYSRFRSGVCHRIKLSTIFKTIQNIYHTILSQRCLMLWKLFIQRETKVKTAILRRNRELLTSTFNYWQFEVTSSLLAKSVSRQRILVKYLAYWNNYISEQRYDKYLHSLLVIHQNKQLIRNIFNEWKNKVTFLDWNTRQTKDKEMQAVRYRYQVILWHWHNKTVQLANQSDLLVTQVYQLRLKRYVNIWHAICLSVWRRRGQLVKQFFSKLKHRKTIRILRDRYIKQGRNFHTSRLIYLTFQRLKQRINSIKKLKPLNSLVANYQSIKQRNQLKTELAKYINIYVNKKIFQRKLKQSTTFYLTNYFKNWKSNYLYGKRIDRVSNQLIRYNRYRYQTSGFQYLINNLIVKRLHKDINRKLNSHLKQLVVRKLYIFIYQLFYQTRRSRIIKSNKLIIYRKCNRLRINSAFQSWSMLWIRCLRLQLTASKESSSILANQVDNQLNKLVEVAKIKENLLNELNGYKHNIQYIELELTNRESEYTLISNKLNKLDNEKSELSNQLSSLQNKLSNTLRNKQIDREIIQDSNKSVDNHLCIDINSEKNNNNLLASESKLQELNKRLLDKQLDISNLTNHLSGQLTTYQNQLNTSQSNYESLYVTNQQLNTYLSTLITDENSLRTQIEKLNSQIEKIQSDSQRILRDKKSDIRNKIAKINVLVSQTGEAEAHLSGLRDMISNEEIKRSRMKIDEIYIQEDREMNELKSLMPNRYDNSISSSNNNDNSSESFDTDDCIEENEITTKKLNQMKSQKPIKRSY